MAGLFGTEFFGSNPFSSQVGNRIEIATDHTRPAEDWTLILEICDMTNETDEGPKDAARAIRKRLSNHKNPKSILYTLTVTEALVKNCGLRFHRQIATKEFLADMTKTLGQKRQPSNLPAVVQERVLSLIQSWADAFRNAPDLQQINICYDALKQEGHEFPAQDMDNLSPIFTPDKLSDNNSAPHHQQAPQPAQIDGGRTRTFAPQVQLQNRPQTAPVGRVAATGPVNPSPEQLAKLRSELDIVEGNVRVLNEMLSELQPGQENPDDFELLVELNKTCREMQKRLVALVDRIANEEITGVLLKINDALNNVFIRYDRYERNRKTVTGQNTEATSENQPMSPQRTLAADTRTTGESSLIEFTDTPSSTNHHQQDDEFDMFAQSRGTTFADSRLAGSTYADNTEDVPNEGVAGVLNARGPYSKLPPPRQPQQDQVLSDDIEDVEKWLQGNNLEEIEAQEREAREAEARRNAHPPRPVGTSADAQTLSSSEFDKFLSERATTGSQRVVASQKEPAVALQNVASGENNTDEMFAL